MKSQTQGRLAKAEAAIRSPMKYDAFLEAFGDRDRQSFLRHCTLYETKHGAGTADTWRRMACVLLKLAGHAPRVSAQQTIQFYIPDGRYRKQVFAIHALDDGSLAVYAPNILPEAVAAGILGKPRQSEGETQYRVRESGETLTIDSLDGRTPDPAVFYKDMTGWNRKAICITLPAKASAAQVKAAEILCALAAQEWAEQPASV
jgi:hypothetical protein